MTNKFNIKIECILDGIRNQAEKNNIELIVETLYSDDHPLKHKAALLRNETTNKYGIVCIDLEDAEPDEVQFMIFNDNLYKYSKQEGFDHKSSYEAFGDKILKNVEMKTFVSSMIS